MVVLFYCPKLQSRPICLPDASESFVYYESMKRKLKIKPIYECRCNGRLQTKRFTCLAHTGLVVELEHVKIKTRLTNILKADVLTPVPCACVSFWFFWALNAVKSVGQW
jgi:hypothetical protein